MNPRRLHAHAAVHDERSSDDPHELKKPEPLLESRSPAMINLLDKAERVATSDATVMLTGESGTGKDVPAEQIHRWSNRANRRLITINCTTLAESLFENELFGHVRGAFTGAVNDRAGWLEAADGGTVLFDEIAELSPALQTRLLRFIEEHRIERLGSNRTIEVDVRVSAATIRNLPVEEAAGRSREDLYHRLNVVSFRLPPLRERSADILLFANWMLGQACLKAARACVTLSPEAVETLMSYRWPGNLRELRNAMDCAVALTQSATIEAHDLPETIRNPEFAIRLSDAHAGRLKDFEREHIMRALAESSTLDEAATVLGINVATLWRKRKRFGID